MKLELFYPVRIYKVNSHWGVFVEDPNNPGHSIYEKFGFKLHNGEDLALVDGQEIRAPFDCVVVRAGTRENGMWQPNGGGIYLGLLSKNFYDFPDGTYQVLIDFLHCQELKVKEGDEVKVGELVALGDSTGFVTGAHTHMQPRRVIWVNRTLTFIDKNDANGSFDPDPYWNGHYADEWLIVYSLEQVLVQLKKLLGI